MERVQRVEGSGRQLPLNGGCTRERLLLAAADFGMKPEDPEWIFFAAPTSALYAIERAIGDVRKAASEAANDIIRTTSNRLDALGKQATDQLAANADSYNQQMLEKANAALAQMQITLAQDIAKAMQDHLAQSLDPLIARPSRASTRSNPGPCGRTSATPRLHRQSPPCCSCCSLHSFHPPPRR